jgi:hypothetical protein
MDEKLMRPMSYHKFMSTKPTRASESFIHEGRLFVLFVCSVEISQTMAPVATLLG